MKTHTRCQHCRARRALPRHPDAYFIQPKCRNCGHRGFTVDKYRMAGKDKKPTCQSDCYHFPHRMGCVGCKFEQDGSYKEYTE